MAYMAPMPAPERQQRKVSFSDVVVTSSRLEKTNTDVSESPRPYTDEISLEERPNESPTDESGNPIMVNLIESPVDELVRNTPLINESRSVFGVKLGMLKQVTEYRVEFNVPDQLPAGQTELLRYVSDLPGHAEIPINLTAAVELIECVQCVSGPGHTLTLKVSTTRQHSIQEFFTLRLVNQPTQAVILILHGLSLGRGQGTPFLHSGIHQIGRNPDFDDSDEFTEWQGFSQVTEDDETPDETG